METGEAAQWAILRQQPRHASYVQCREQLILKYTPLVRYVASRIAARLADASREDLISYGMFGLIESIDRFDPDLGVKFESYATSRIQGSIIDELRALDWAPRSVRSRARWVAAAQERLEQRLGRAPSTTELAAELDWTLTEVHAARSDTEVSYINSLEAKDQNDEHEEPHGAHLVDISVDDPVLAAEVELTRTAVAQGLVRLPDRERAVAYMYWAAGLTLGEIGDVLGISESWACQLYTNATLRLREDLAYLR